MYKKLDDIYWFQFILWEKKYFVSDENELSLIFEMMVWDDEVSNILHWNIIMDLDEKLMEIIKTYKWLISCLKNLNEKNSYLLLIKIWDILINIVNNSWELGEILARIAEETNKLRLIKQMRNKWLVKLINNSADLLNILEWVYWNVEKEVLDILWTDNLKELFSYPRDLFEVLHYLDDVNKDYLVDNLWLNEISKKVRNQEDFMLLIKAMSVSKVKQFLALYSKKQIKVFFKNEIEFKKFLSKLSERKEIIFLNYLWIKTKH